MDDDHAPPLVTVILPIRDEERRIRGCLTAVLAQDHPADRLEILAVDGRSAGATRAIVAELAAADPRLRLLDNPAGIVPTAMNAGLAAATDEVIVRVDGHTIVAPDYVRQCVAALARYLKEEFPIPAGFLAPTDVPPVRFRPLQRAA